MCRFEKTLLYASMHAQIACNFSKILRAGAGGEHQGKRERREMYFLHV